MMPRGKASAPAIIPDAGVSSRVRKRQAGCRRGWLARHAQMGLSDRALKVVGSSQRRGLVRVPQFLFGLMIELLVSTVGLSGLLPQFVSPVDDLFPGGVFHLLAFGLQARPRPPGFGEFRRAGPCKPHCP